MSDKPRTTKVYLMVECEVEDWKEEHSFSDEERAQLTVSEAVFLECKRSIEGNGYAYDRFGPVKIKEPTILPGNIQKILFRESIKHLPLHKQLEAAVIEESNKPAFEQWKSLVDRGVINEKGEVLLKSPWNEGGRE